MDDQTPPSGDAETRDTTTRRRKERHRAVALVPEFRFYQPTMEVRRVSQADTDIIILRGSAIVYDAPYVVRDMFGEFEERMHAGCATSLLARGVDCRFLHNHEGMALARTTAGTLDLIDGPHSLDVEVRLDARQQVANDLAIAVERGDENQMSIGMIVGRDAWGDNGTMETRDVFDLSDLLDVSQVTYACSPTTHLEVAKRMAFAMPLESRARLRKMEVELRAGKVLSADSQSKLVSALTALHDLATAGGVDPSALGPDDDEDAPDGHQDGSDDAMGNAESDAGVVFADGSGARDVADEAEHRDEEAAAEDVSEAVEAPEPSTMKASTLRLMVEAGRHGNVAD